MRSPSRYIASSSLIAEMRSLRSTNTRLDMFNPSASSRADIDAIRSYVSSRQLSEVSVKQLEMHSNFGYLLVTPLRASVSARRQSHVWPAEHTYVMARAAAVQRVQGMADPHP